jgi:hypothetical protein
MKRLFSIVVLGCLVFGPGCARTGEKKVERAIEELLPGYLGPAKKYSVQVQTKSLGALMRGRVKSVHIDGKEVSLRPDLIAETLTIDAKEIEIDRAKQTISNVGEARFTARIREASLRQFVQAHRPKLAALKVSLRGSQLEVNVTPEVFGYPTVPISVVGSLLSRNDGAMLDFEPDQARLTILPIPKPILSFVAEKLNPMVDFSDLKAPIRVERAEVRGGALILSGFIPSEEITKLRR